MPCPVPEDSGTIHADRFIMPFERSQGLGMGWFRFFICIPRMDYSRQMFKAAGGTAI